RCGGHQQPVAPHELARPVPRGSRSCAHRPPFEKGPEIFGKGLDRWIALRGLLSERFSKNEIQVLWNIRGETARNIWFAMTDHPCEVRGLAFGSDSVRRFSGEQRVEHRPQ